MSTLVQALFSDPSKKASEDQQQQLELTQIAQARAQQQAQDEAAATAGALAAAKPVRGARLLVSKEAGGLGGGSTLGTA